LKHGLASKPLGREVSFLSPVRRWLFDTIHDSLAAHDNQACRIFNAGMLILITANITAVILETEPDIYQRYAPFFHAFDAASVAVFTVEYLLRLWVCTLDPRYSSPIFGRLRFAVSGMALVDLIAILPFFLPLVAVDLRFIRSVRLFRLFRVLKMGHYSKTLSTLIGVLRAKKEELLLTAFSGSILLIVASSLMYLVERESQPEAFASIPRAMWWGAMTLTTVGYGDIYPQTAAGKLIGACIAVLGIGLFALPAGILAGGFASELGHRHRRAKKCPHCGQEIADDDE
jgi:voltage-gated potassium channel